MQRRRGRCGLGTWSDHACHNFTHLDSPSGFSGLASDRRGGQSFRRGLLTAYALSDLGSLVGDSLLSPQQRVGGA